MQRILALRFSWVSFAGFLLAAAIFLPAVRLEAQAPAAPGVQPEREGSLFSVQRVQQSR